MWQHLQFQRRVTATLMTTVTRKVARNSGTGRMPRLQLRLRLKLLLLNLSSLQWTITARLVDTPSSSRGGSIGHQKQMYKKYCSPCWLSLFSSSTEANSCSIWMQLHDPTNTLTTCNKLFAGTSTGAVGCNWIELCARGAMADAQLPLMPKTSSLPICEFVT